MQKYILLRQETPIVHHQVTVNFAEFFPETMQLSLSHDTKSYHLFFDSRESAETSLEAIKKLLGIQKDKNAPKVKHNNPNSSSYTLTQTQWQALRKIIRQSALQTMPSNEFVFKSLRVDEFNYFRKFITMVNPPNAKYPLRQVSKKKYTVTGKGVFQRTEAPNETTGHLTPIKTPQYKAEEKAGFSKAQPASLGQPDFHTPVFGFDKRKEKLVGALFLDRSENTLLTDRNYIYDGGTVGRPYDFEDCTQAQQYYQDRSGKTLFSKEQLPQFKEAIKQDPNCYNEMLIRLRWTTNKNCQIFVGSDTLSARLWAQEYAQIMKNYLLANHLCDESYNIPLCFYIPKNNDLNFREYTAEEQRLDVL